MPYIVLNTKLTPAWRLPLTRMLTAVTRRSWSSARGVLPAQKQPEKEGNPFPFAQPSWLLCLGWPAGVEW
jgi:hypothetical protein